MTLTRGIPLHLHGAIEVFLAPAVMAAPFILGFGQFATAVAIAFGALVLAIALQIEGPGRAVPISAHAELDYALALFALLSGLGIAIAGGAWAESAFLVGIGAAQVGLTASTRFSLPRSA
jgi:hypothetical protein